jgi:hypothetical protein
MKKHFLLAVLALLFSAAAEAQTNLTLTGLWNNGAPMRGTVTLEHFVGQSDSGAWKTSIVEPFSSTGTVSILAFVIQPNVTYRCIVSTTNPTTQTAQSYEFVFIVPSLILDPSKLKAASYGFTANVLDNTLVPGSVHINVTM